VAYSYDAYGNLTSDGVKSYTYDAENRLVSVTDGASTTSYTYNGDGDRMSQTVDGVTTSYVIDTAAPLTLVLAENTGTDTIYGKKQPEIKPVAFCLTRPQPQSDTTGLFPSLQRSSSFGALVDVSMKVLGRAIFGIPSAFRSSPVSKSPYVYCQSLTPFGKPVFR
jgi:YD repeat-containing protein